MSATRNYYEILGVSKTAALDEIKRKYREHARKYHPDVVPERDKMMGKKIFLQINQAYRTLSDQDRRVEYDKSMKAAALAANPFLQGAGAGGSESGARRSFRPPSDLAKLLTDADGAFFEGNYDQARSLSLEALQSDPKNVRALTLLGDSLAQLNKLSEAVTAYQLALQVAPNSLVQVKLNRVRHQMEARTQSPYVAQSMRSQSNSSGGHHAFMAGAHGGDSKESNGIFGRFFGRK